MYFDSTRNAYIDKDSGEIICYEENNSSRANHYQVGTFALPPSSTPHIEDPAISTVELDLIHMHTHFQPPSTSKSNSIYQVVDRVKNIFKIDKKNQHMRILSENDDEANTSANTSSQTVNSSPLTNLEHGQAVTNQNEQVKENNDWKIANMLQSLEFEIAENTYNRDNYQDFETKEISASNSLLKQLMTFSALICLVQIILLICMIETDGFASSSENSSMGPPAYALVRYGAKESALIVYDKEIWRLFSSLFLHAGIFHLIPNVVIQLRVGGYLNLIFGNVKFFIIYFVSGIFGTIMSCLFIPDSVGVGSSGALLGLLCSWVVWIFSRWNLIPKECHNQRNCQITVVIVSIVVTFATSFMPNVDWSAHFGGGLMGFLLGIVLLVKKGQRKFNFDNFLNADMGNNNNDGTSIEEGHQQEDNINNLNNIILEIIDEDLSEEEKQKWKRRDFIIDVLQKISYILIFVFFFISILYLSLFLKPSKANLDYWNENDQW